MAERHKQSVCRICAMNGSETKSSWRNDSRYRPEKQDAETWQIMWEKIEREQSSAADEMNGKLQLTAELCKAESRTQLNPWADKDCVWKISQISCRVIVVIMFAYVTLASVNSSIIPVTHYCKEAHRTCYSISSHISILLSSELCNRAHIPNCCSLYLPSQSHISLDFFHIRSFFSIRAFTKIT